MLELSKYLMVFIIFCAFNTPQSVEGGGAVRIWQNLGSNLTVPANWGGAVPSSGDEGQFPVVGNHTPSLTTGESLNIQLMTFLAGSSGYNFSLSGVNTTLLFEGTETNLTGGAAGVLSQSSGDVNFNLSDSATIRFFNAASAFNQQGIGTAIYNVGDAIAHTSATMEFFDTSSAGMSLINVTESSVVSLHDQATAGGSIFTLDSSGSLLFEDNTSAGISTIDANDLSLVIFEGTSTAGNSDIALNGTSTLTFQDSATVGSVRISTAADTTVNFQQSSDIFSGGLSGNGTINKTGTALLTITSDNSSFSGVTNINNGNVSLNGSLGGVVNVQSSGSLSGIGTIAGNLNILSGGKVSPGNSIGTLTVNGDYQQSNSTYQVQVDVEGQVSLINVGGTATIGANASVEVIPLFTQLPSGEMIRKIILHANDGVLGTFSTVTTANPLLFVALSYDPNNVFLIYQNLLSANAITFNEFQVANQLAAIVDPTEEETAILTTLAGLSAAQQQQALDQMSAEQYTNALIIAEGVNRRFVRRLYDPLRSIITADPCCQQDFCDCECPIDVWEAGSWDRAIFKGNRNAAGFTSSGGEFSMGAQVHCTKNFLFGVAVCYGKDHVHYNVGGSGKNQTGLGALYALYRPKCFYFLTDLVFGYSRQKISRPIDIGDFHFEKHGKPGLFQGTFYVEAGKDYRWDNLLLQPFLGFEFGYYSRDSIHEHSADTFLDVSVHQKSRGTADSRLGVHLSTEWCSCWSLAVDIAWQYRLASFSDDVEELFTTFGSEFIIKGIPLARNSVDGAVNLSYEWNDRWQFYIETMGQLWENDSWYSLLGGLQYTW